jgi:hypothetical protein
MAGVTVGYWTGGFTGKVSNPADHAGYVSLLIGPGVRPGAWQVAVVDAATCPVDRDGALMAQGCTLQSDTLTVHTTAHCEGVVEGDGAVQWPVVQFQQN